MHGKTLNAKLRYEGQVFDTNLNGELEVIDFKNAKEVKVRFVDTGYETVTYLTQILKGDVRDWSLSRVYGVGIVDKDLTKASGNHTKDYHYKVWSSMLQRCYDTKLHADRPTYIGCSVSENFKSLTYFLDWTKQQVGAETKDEKGRRFHLDKDILFKGNKLYSEDTCCFIPHDINVQLTVAKCKRGNLPLGVSLRKGGNKYRAQIKSEGVVKDIGIFDTPEEAFYAYKKAKETYLKDLATKWKDKIDHRVYEALMNYQVEITD